MSTLGEELERAQAYLEIMRIRMGDRLDVQIQVPESLKATPFPPMMLQTLVENCDQARPRAGARRRNDLDPRARSARAAFRITVADDGPRLQRRRRRHRHRAGRTCASACAWRMAMRRPSRSWPIPRGVAATITAPG
jgi:LytS/YehU family sensor histidine kinase